MESRIENGYPPMTRSVSVRNHLGAASQSPRLFPTTRRPAQGAETLVAHTQYSPDRERIEAFIRSEFREHFDAHIQYFMPLLVGLHGHGGNLSAAVGCRSAAQDTLFLEKYAQAPIEELMLKQLKVRVRRDQIVEVGSLACRNGRAATTIVRALIPYLIEAGYSWVVFTGADTVIRVFERLRLFPQHLCVANKSMLGAEQDAWGTYYDHSPNVMAGQLIDGVAALETARSHQ